MPSTNSARSRSAGVFAGSDEAIYAPRSDGPRARAHDVARSEATRGAPERFRRPPFFSALSPKSPTRADLAPELVQLVGQSQSELRAVLRRARPLNQNNLGDRLAWGLASGPSARAEARSSCGGARNSSRPWQRQPQSCRQMPFEQKPEGHESVQVGKQAYSMT